MATIPIPKSIKKSLSVLFSGSAFDVLWKLGVGSVFILLIYTLSQMGVFGALIGAALFSTLFSDDVRSLVSDLWTRDFMTV